MTRSTSYKPILRRLPEATVLYVAGVPVKLLLSAAETGGQFSLFEIVCPPAEGVPPHTHTCEDETFHVLSGLVEFTIDAEQHILGPGTTAFAPRGIPHAFRNIGASEARILVTATPGGLERFFQACHEQMPTDAPFNPDRFIEIAAQHGIMM